jgi:xanthine/uracil/vitamin C permease (AzgA family)
VVAAAGLILGLILLVLGATGWIVRLARAIPQSVSAGLQLGLGLLMGFLGVKLMRTCRDHRTPRCTPGLWSGQGHERG